MDAIFQRRSIRKYTAETVSAELIEELLTAAMCAPSAGNEQPWHFVVINDRAVLDQIPNIHPHAAMLKEAPVAILLCGDPTLEKHTGYWVQDCSAAVENVLIAATAKGLGAVWLGVFPREQRVKGMRELLAIPERVIPFALIPVGFPAEEKEPAQRFDQTRVHYNKWRRCPECGSAKVDPAVFGEQDWVCEKCGHRW